MLHKLKESGWNPATFFLFSSIFVFYYEDATLLCQEGVMPSRRIMASMPGSEPRKRL